MASKLSQKSIQKLEKQIMRVQQSTGTVLPQFIPLHNWLRMHSRLYYRWHILWVANPIHWIVFSSLVLLVSSAVLTMLIYSLWYIGKDIELTQLIDFLF